MILSTEQQSPLTDGEFMDIQQLKLSELKAKSPTELLAFAEELEVENASSMRKQDMMFAILKELAEQESQTQTTTLGDLLAEKLGKNTEEE